MIAAIVAMLAAAAPAGAAPVARVDAAVVTLSDVRERQRVLSQRGGAATPQQALRGLVDEVLLAGEARKLGLDRDPAVTEQLAAARATVLADSLIADAAARAAPGDDMLKELYHSSGDTVRLLLSRYGSEPEARAALARVKGGLDLREEAKSSIDPALARKGGDTGTTSRGGLDPALAAVAFRVDVGELFGPVELKLGWAIGRVLERAISDESGFAARREALAAFARRRIAEQTRQHLAQQIRAKHGVKLDESFLRSLGNRTDATPAELDHVIATVNGVALRYRAVHPGIAAVAGAGGHLAGPGTKVALAERVLEERLLASAAVQRGLDKTPEVTSALAGLEWNVLASAYAARVAKDPRAGTADAKLRAKLDELRSRAKIQVDDAPLAALAAPPPQHPAPLR